MSIIEGVIDEPLNPSLKAGVALGLAFVIALFVGVLLALHERRQESARTENTSKTLGALVRLVHYVQHTKRGACAADVGRLRDLARAVRSQGTIVVGSQSGEPHVDPCDDDDESRHFTVEGDDGWGHVIHYCCPGPVHRRGWDLYSAGPNGIDEHGQGDDILVGEDVALIGSGR